MRITSVRIRNFRGIRDLELKLGRVTVLIGENNSGKTSVLDALKICLRDLGPRGRAAFAPFDFHLADDRSEPASAAPITIEVRFQETENETWDDELAGRLNRAGILQVDVENHRFVYLRITCEYDRESRDFVSQWLFLNQDGDALTGTNGRALTVLQDSIRCYYLTALRDAARHFDAKGPFWRPFLQESHLSLERKAEIETKLQDVNEFVVSSHASFDQVRDRLRQVQSVVPLAAGEAVSIEAVPNRMFDILARAQVHLGTSSGSRIPLNRHGEGTQSLAVLMLFSAFLGAQDTGSAVLALEEPEAHLHPSAIRTMWKLVRDFTGQKLISTHSGELLAETDILDVRRLARTGKGIQAFQVGPGKLEKEETRKFNYHIRRDRGELLFARCWLLVEGQSERWVYPAAAHALGLGLHQSGVRLVEYSQTDVGMLAKVANELGIPWYCVGDNDGNRQSVEPKLAENLAGAHEVDRFTFPYLNLEVHLLSKGYEDIYSEHMPEQKLGKITSNRGDQEYWTKYAAQLPRKAKTRAAADVARAMETRGKDSVPPEIRMALERAVSLAEIGRG